MKIQLDKTQSDAIRIAVLLATLLVVLRHAFNLHRFYLGGIQGMDICDANVFTQCFVSEFTALAIPTFFFISGLLFFVNVGGYSDIASKLHRRVFSLLLPYCTWNVMILAILCLLALSPVLLAQLEETYSFAWSWSWFLKRLTIKPVVGQFWYIRTLMLFCLCSPVLLCVYRCNILSAIVGLFLYCHWFPVDCGIFSSEGGFWFFVGGYVGYTGICGSIIKIQQGWPLLLLVICADILCSIFHVPSFINWTARIILSVYFLLQLSIWLASKSRVSEWLCNCSKHAFFIYALHAILLSLPELVLSRMLSHTPLNSFLAYWGCIAGAIFASVFASWSMRTFLPKFCEVLNGGR